MKKTSAFGLIVAGMLACSGTRAELDEQKHLQFMQRLQAELKLTDQQRQEVSKIFEETRPQLEALRKQGQELREKMHARLKTVLTAEQMEKFEKFRQKRGGRQQGRPGRGN